MPEYTGRPLYLRIADDLRRRILDGGLEPGAQLPSIAELVGDYGTSTTTVRQAIAVLRSEGLVLGFQGKGTYVRSTRQRHIHLVNHLYGSRPSGSPMAMTIAAAGAEARWDHRSRTESASQAIADRLFIERGDPVMATEYRFFADDDPIMISTSFEPVALTRGTAIEWPEEGDVLGVVARFDSIGLHVTRVEEHVTARAPRPYEDEALRIPVGIPVMSVERSYFSDNTVVETADIIVAADNYTLTYVVPIRPQEPKRASPVARGQKRRT